MVKMSRRAAVALMVVVVAACGGSPVHPSSPPAPVPTPGTDTPAVRLSVRADDSGARDAVAGLSEVVVDASASRHQTVFVSAGRRGLQLELAPADLVRLSSALLAPVARDHGPG